MAGKEIMVVAATATGLITLITNKKFSNKAKPLKTHTCSNHTCDNTIFEQ
jgi:hypothetical protein